MKTATAKKTATKKASPKLVAVKLPGELPVVVPAAQAATAVAPVVTQKPAAAPAKKAAPKAEKKAAKPKEEFFGEKLRSKGDILGAMKKGGHLFLAPEGLYRMLLTDGKKQRVSKRRASSMIAAGVLVAAGTENGGKLYAVAPKTEPTSVETQKKVAAAKK